MTNEDQAIQSLQMFKYETKSAEWTPSSAERIVKRWFEGVDWDGTDWGQVARLGNRKPSADVLLRIKQARAI